MSQPEPWPPNWDGRDIEAFNRIVFKSAHIMTHPLIPRINTALLRLAANAPEIAVSIHPDDPDMVLRDCKRELLQLTQVPDKLKEAVARIIYEQWVGKPKYVPWVEGGNSHMQTEARALAWEALKL